MPHEKVEFVDSILPAATVRLSLSVDPWRVLLRGTNVAPPDFRRTQINTLMYDGAIIPAAAFDNRVLRLHVQLDASDPSVAATMLQRLNRELNRATNIIRWQPDPAIPPVYFRTFRAPDYETEIDHGINLYDLTLSIPAEPFAIGHRVDLSAITVNSDPAAGSNGRFFDISDVQGDVETPLLIKGPMASLLGNMSAFGLRRRGVVSNLPYVLQAESMNMGVAAALTANSALWSGSGSNSVTISPTDGVNDERLTTNLSPFIAGSSVDYRGTYRVFVRAFTSSGAEFKMSLQHGSNAVNAQSVSMTNSGGLSQVSHYDLGLVQIPEGYDPVYDGPSGVELPTVTQRIALNAQRISASGTVRVDYLLFVPVDDKFCLVNWGGTVFGSNTVVLDGYTRSCYVVSSGGVIQDTDSFPYIVGDFLMVSPGVTNRITFIRNVEANSGNADTPTSSIALTISYWPRYLYVRPVTS